MRVLFLNPVYDGGGAERYARELLERLPSHGAEVTWYVARRGPGAPANVRSLRLGGEQWLRVLEPRGKLFDWRFVGSRLRLRSINRGDFDIVHLHNVHGGWTSLKAVHRLSCRIPTVWSLHDEFGITGGLPYDLSRVIPAAELDATWGIKSYLHPGDPGIGGYLEFVRKWLPQPVGLICHSEHMMSLLRGSKRWPRTRAHLIRIGVTLLDEPACGMDRAEAKARLGLPPGKPVVLLIASVVSSPFKGMRYAVEALRHVGPDMCTCLLVGRGTGEVAGQIPQRSVELGFVTDQARLATAYRAADVMLFPSIGEAFGLVGAESLACETPVVGFRLGGLIELTGDGERGLLAAPLDARELADHVLRLLGDRELATRLGRAGREWVAAHCRVEDSVSAVVRAYGQAIEDWKSGVRIGGAAGARQDS